MTSKKKQFIKSRVDKPSDTDLNEDDSDLPESQYFSYDEVSEISDTELLSNMRDADLPRILTKIFQRLNFICQKANSIEKSQDRTFNSLKIRS